MEDRSTGDLDIVLGDGAVAGSNFFAAAFFFIDDGCVPFIELFSGFEVEETLEDSSVNDFDILFGEGTGADFVSAAEGFSLADDGCVTFTVLDFEMFFVDDLTGVGAVEDLKDTFSTFFEDLRVASVLVGEETELFIDIGGVDVCFCDVLWVSILAELSVDWFWLYRLFALRFGDTWSLAEELLGVDMLTRSPTICGFFPEFGEVLVLGLSLADGILDGVMLIRSPTIWDLLELEDGELELALGLLLPDVDEGDEEDEGEDE